MSLLAIGGNPGLYRDSETAVILNIRDFTERILEFSFLHEGAHNIGKNAQVFVQDIYCFRNIEITKGGAQVELFLDHCSKFSAPLAALSRKKDDAVEQRLLRLETEVFKMPGVSRAGHLAKEITAGYGEKVVLRFTGESAEAAGTTVYVKTLQRERIT